MISLPSKGIRIEAGIGGEQVRILWTNTHGPFLSSKSQTLCPASMHPSKGLVRPLADGFGIQLERRRAAGAPIREITVKSNSEMSCDELVEYATFLYGDEWRDQLPEKLEISRRELVVTLASGAPIPPKMAIAVLNLMLKYLDQLRGEQKQIQQRVDRQLRSIDGTSTPVTQPKVSRSRAG